MTISIDLPKYKVSIRHQSTIGYREREIEFDVQWISCGLYQLSYYRPSDAKSHCIIVEDDWYPPNISISFTPEQFDKVFELFPAAPKEKRIHCYKAFYENFTVDNGMFDFCHDTLFQAYKDPCPNTDKVYMVNRKFIYGAPTADICVLGLKWNDFLRLKELIDSKKNKIFYSGVKVDK